MEPPIASPIQGEVPQGPVNAEPTKAEPKEAKHKDAEPKDSETTIDLKVTLEEKDLLHQLREMVGRNGNIYQKRIAELEMSESALTKENEQLRTDITNAQASRKELESCREKVKSLQQAAQDREETVESLQREINVLKEKREQMMKLLTG